MWVIDNSGLSCLFSNSWVFNFVTHIHDGNVLLTIMSIYNNFNYFPDFFFLLLTQLYYDLNFISAPILF